MANNISEKALSIIEKMQRNEVTESAIYGKISNFVKGDENRQALRRLSQEENAHYQIWQKYTGKMMKPKKRQGVLVYPSGQSARLYLCREADGTRRGTCAERI